MPAHRVSRHDPAEELRTIALRLFVEAGYAGASLQQIAEAAGYSKSSVLYHFASKEALLESALAPAVDRLGVLLDTVAGRISDDTQRAAFVEEFIDFLLEHRFEAHIIINQGQTLAGLATVDRARGYIVQLGATLLNSLPSVQERVRLSVAMAGAAYVLATTASERESLETTESLPHVRQALIDVVCEVMLPLAVETQTTLSR